MIHPGPAALAPPVAPPTLTSASVAAVFSDYRDFDTPTYHDLPLVSSEDPQYLVFWMVPNGDDDRSSASVAAVEFCNPKPVGAQLILQVTLWSGKKALVAQALIDLGLDGDFVNSGFICLHGLSLLCRKYPIKASGFDGSPLASCPITHFWSGAMTMIGSDSCLFDSSINLNSTLLGGVVATSA